MVLMGVTGSGKTTVGKLPAEELGWAFYDADYHLASNIEKIHEGIPLTTRIASRAPDPRRADRRRFEVHACERTSAPSS